MGWKIFFAAGIICLLMVSIRPGFFSSRVLEDDQIFKDEVSGKQAAPKVRPSVKAGKVKKVRPRRSRKDRVESETKDTEVKSADILPDEVKEEITQITRQWQEWNNIAPPTATPSRSPEGEFDPDLAQALDEPENAPSTVENSRGQWESDSAAYLSEELGMEEETFSEYEKIRQNLYGEQREFFRQRGRIVNPRSINDLSEDEVTTLSAMREEADGDLRELLGEDKYEKYQDYIDEYLDSLPESERERALLQFVI